jgi:hypothetical protein
MALRLMLAVAAAGACNKSPAPGPSGTVYLVTITAAGVSPKNIEVPLGARVRFQNNDSRQHYMHSDPHPDATDCVEMNQVGVLSPTQTRETGNLVVARVCGYHDHDLFNDASLKGTITIR